MSKLYQNCAAECVDSIFAACMDILKQYYHRSQLCFPWIFSRTACRSAEHRPQRRERTRRCKWPIGSDTGQRQSEQSLQAGQKKPRSSGNRRNDRRGSTAVVKGTQGRTFAEHPGRKLCAQSGVAEGNPETGWRRAKAGNPHGSRPCDSAGNRAEAAKHLGAFVFRQQLRRRFRMYIWKQWKKPKTKVANLRKLGIPADKAYQLGNSRRGYWRIAGSPVLKCSIANERLAAAGYFGILNYYESLHLCG